MTMKAVGLFAMVALVFALAFSAAAPAAPNGPSPNAAIPVVHAMPNAAATPAAEPHPEIRAAIDALRNAKEHLNHAAHDFGGHRVDALHAIDEAQRQLEICMKYDR
jgi:hypothetical protein